MRNESFPGAILAAMLALLCAACVQPSKGSEEWRLRSLEENFLSFQEAQLKQQAEIRRLSEEIQTLRQNHPAALPAYSNQAALTPAGAASTSLQNYTQPQQTLTPGTNASPPTPLPNYQAQPPQPVVRPQTATSPVAPAKTTASSTSGQAQYDAALKTLRTGGNNAKAQSMFQGFMQQFPNSSLMPNALYWLGETYYHDGNFPQAIMTFKEGLSKYPQSNKASACLLKTGYAYEKLGDRDNARLNLQALLSNYPNSDLRNQARAALERLGK